MKRIPQRDAAEAIHNREAFTASSMRGARTKVPSTGDLPEEYAEAYRAADVVYTVLSYETPIAWVTEDGTVTMPPVRYSLTTTNHQNITDGAFRGHRYGYFGAERRAVPVGTYGPRSGW